MFSTSWLFPHEQALNSAIQEVHFDILMWLIFFPYFYPLLLRVFPEGFSFLIDSILFPFEVSYQFLPSLFIIFHLQVFAPFLFLIYPPPSCVVYRLSIVTNLFAVPVIFIFFAAPRLGQQPKIIIFMKQV